MSNPYGPPGSPDNSEPGEPSLYPPYQGNPYSGGNPYGGPGAAGPAAAPAGPTGHGVDAVSITGFVLSLTCCLSLVGMILGFVGLSRTKNNARSGRWAAVSAIAIGAVGTLAGAGLLAFFIWFGTSTVSTGSADVGQCVNVDDFNGSNDATLFKKDCDEAHDAEIVVTGDFDSDQVDLFDDGGAEAVCVPELDTEYLEAFQNGGYDLDIVFESQEPDVNEEFLCFLELADGDDLEEPIVE
ncbi:DUF4190 domain-containing protein [Nocardioides stalactiti]|uniref:DUF4190 domain-containing protein n=1 Tax=Nocardioides stalactiti TaxID=2755356 RepID=UPI0016016775|nr:DUF4190 domain-containing protein [Nocardioides stalactiti]